MPTNCPVCSTTVVKPEDEAAHRCSNNSCPAQFFELLKHFVSKGAINIDGLGERWCQILIDQKMVTDLADLYTLTIDQLLNLDRMGDKLATRIITNIEASKQIPLSRLLFALGIIHVGTEVAELLTQTYDSIDKIAAANEEELAELPGIGPKIANSIATYFRVETNRSVIEKFRSSGMNLHQKPHLTATESLHLSGKTFVVTGILSRFTRSESESMIKDLGGKVTSSVSKNTDYVVVGESPGSKLTSANNLGIQILDEEKFVELLAPPSVEIEN